MQLIQTTCSRIHIHHNPPTHLARDDLVVDVQHLGKPDQLHCAFKLLWIEVGGKPIPGALANLLRRIHRIHAGKRHVAKNEGQHRAMQLITLRQPAGGHGASVFRLGNGVDEGRATGHIHHPGPAFGAHRPLARF